MPIKRRKYTTGGPVHGLLRIEEPSILSSGPSNVVFLSTGLGGYYADLETTKDIIAQLAAIVAEHEKRKPALQVSITGDDFRV